MSRLSKKETAPAPMEQKRCGGIIKYFRLIQPGISRERRPCMNPRARKLYCREISRVRHDIELVQIVKNLF